MATSESSPLPPAEPPAPLPAEPTDEPAPEESERVVLGAGIDFTDPNSPLAPYYFRVSHVLAVAVLAAVFSFMSSCIPVWHTDIWGHMRFGEEMVRTGRLPDGEPFPESMADKTRQYVHYQWIAQAGAYLVYEAGRALSGPGEEAQLGGGALMLSTVHALIVTLRMLVLLLAFSRLTGSMPFAVLGVVLTFALDFFYHLAVLRPQILGELGFAVVLLALSRPLLSRRAVLLLPVVFLVWVNSHATVVMGLVVLGAALAGRFIEVAWPREDGQPASLAPHQRWQWLLGPFRHPVEVVCRAGADVAIRRLALALVLSLLATLVNPHGPMLWSHSVAMSRNENIIIYMDEWKSLPIRSIVGHVFLVCALLLALLFRVSPARFTPLQVLLLALFGWQALAHARMMVWFLMVVPWVAIPHLYAAYRRYLPGFLEDGTVLSFKKTLAAAAIGLLIVHASLPAWWLLYGRQPVGTERVMPRTPVQAVRYLRERYQNDVEGKLRRGIFVSESQGDYLLWALRLDPPIHLSCYSHVHLFTPEHWRKCYQVKDGQHGWQEVLDDWQVEFIVLEYDLYEKHEHAAEGKAPGSFDLIDKIRASGRWRVVAATDPETGKEVLLDRPVFVAERVEVGDKATR